MTTEANHPSALLTAAMILRDVPVAERTFWRWVASGKFPSPDIAIGAKVRFWKRETFENWIADEAKKVKA